MSARASSSSAATTSRMGWCAVSGADAAWQGRSTLTLVISSAQHYTSLPSPLSPSPLLPLSLIHLMSILPRLDSFISSLSSPSSLSSLSSRSSLLIRISDDIDSGMTCQSWIQRLNDLTFSSGGDAVLRPRRVWVIAGEAEGD